MSTKIMLFEKFLSSTDVEQGLQFPTRHQENHLPQIVEGCNYVDFDIKYGDEQKKHTFRCRIRNGIHDLYKKPVISKGRRQVARGKSFQKSDKLIFYKVQGDSVNFKFVVCRKMFRLFGQEIALFSVSLSSLVTGQSYLCFLLLLCSPPDLKASNPNPNFLHCAKPEIMEQLPRYRPSAKMAYGRRKIGRSLLQWKSKIGKVGDVSGTRHNTPFKQESPTEYHPIAPSAMSVSITQSFSSILSTLTVRCMLLTSICFTA
ncbi:putative ABI3/VP1 2 [Quillaja saponaria]|uniref:ABI3/VP1 2 n=1 Tax=Quillaja saponaria TaxID=32244 RepID=A0AAD7M1U2_QUISA|nr:putative ABI3/VP1 2 [Quillaja saponaria]